VVHPPKTLQDAFLPDPPDPCSPCSILQCLPLVQQGWIFIIHLSEESGEDMWPEVDLD
jgi:hypothetical protein